MGQYVVFQMPLETLHSEIYGKRYGRFTEIAHDKLKLCTFFFKLNFRSSVMVVVFYTMNESITGLPKLFILGFTSQFEDGDERYEFSMVDLEA